MTRDELLKRYPHASESFLRANATDLPARPALPHTEQRERPQALARRDEGETPRPGLRHCRFTLIRKSCLDVDAKYASVKDLLDCLAIAGVIRGDKEGEVTLEVNQRKVNKGEPETTIIEVFEGKFEVILRKV